MIFMHTLKTLIDVSFFYTFAVLFGFQYGGEGLLTCALLQSLCFGISSIFSEKRTFRVLSLLPIGLCWYNCLGVLTNTIALITTTGYLLYLVFNGEYTLSLSRQRRIFSIYCTTAPLFLGIMALGGAAEGALAAMPFVFVTLTTSIILMRSLRHDQEIFRQSSYQVFNAASIGGILLIAYAASLDVVLQSLMKILGGAFQLFFAPILTFFAQLISVAVYMVVLLLSKVGLGGAVQNTDEDMPLADFSSPMDETIFADANQSNGYILTIIVAVLGVLGVVCFFRWLAKAYRETDSSAVAMESRRNIPEPINAKRQKKTSGARNVRGIYRKFLKLCISKGMEVQSQDTSLDVEERAAYYLPKEENIVQMRDIYIRHRYDGEQREDDVRVMKKLYQEIKKETKKK